jgi:hypothetical protein
MNFPVGEVVTKAALPVTFAKVINQLAERKFNGYIVQSVSSNCIEEGVLFIRDGVLNACIVECLIAEKTLKGDEALKQFLNQTLGEGFFQVVGLTRSQVDLVTAFDEHLLLVDKVNLKDLPKLIPHKFEPKFSEETQQSDLFEKFGLAGLKKGK